MASSGNLNSNETRAEDECGVKSLEEEFASLSSRWGVDVDSEDFARRLDEEDPLKGFRKRFHYPKKRQLGDVDVDALVDKEEECIYFCGHSLGLQLKSIESNVQRVLANWAARGVKSHFAGHLPAALSDLPVKEKMARLVGAETNEVAVMNGLTVNIQVLLSSFYNPTADRYKILMVDKGFHSDRYAVASHIALRGFDPNTGIIFLQPRKGEHIINPDDILEVIAEQGPSIALIFLEGVQYYTGQLFDMSEICKAGHKQGCVVGFDLAHCVGNVKLQLHDWDVDFGMWCTYKYLNSGPGSMGSIFVHSRWTQDAKSLPSLQGWWGLHNDRKFAFDKEFTPADGADRFKMSNPSPVLTAMILENVEVFTEAGSQRLLAKQRLLTGYLDHLLRLHLSARDPATSSACIRVITPSDPKRRGSQISLLSSVPIAQCDDRLAELGIICDIRKPSVLRVTPIPLYNTFSEVYKFVHILKKIWTSFSTTESS